MDKTNVGPLIHEEVHEAQTKPIFSENQSRKLTWEGLGARGGTWGGGGHKNWRDGISCSATCLPPSYLIGRSSVRISKLSSACPIKLIDFDISLRSSYQVPKRNDMISGLFLLKGTLTLLMVGRSDPGEEADLDMPGVDQGQGLQQQW